MCIRDSSRRAGQSHAERHSPLGTAGVVLYIGSGTLANTKHERSTPATWQRPEDTVDAVHNSCRTLTMTSARAHPHVAAGVVQVHLAPRRSPHARVRQLVPHRSARTAPHRTGHLTPASVSPHRTAPVGAPHRTGQRRLSRCLSPAMDARTASGLYRISSAVRRRVRNPAAAAARSRRLSARCASQDE